MMRVLFNPNDWLARRQWLCLAMLAVLALLSGVLDA